MESAFHAASASGEVRGPWTWDTSGTLDVKSPSLEVRGKFSTLGAIQANEISGSVQMKAFGIPMLERMNVGPCKFVLKRVEAGEEGRDATQNGILTHDCALHAELAQAKIVDTEWAIPAPLDVLRGKVNLQAHGQFAADGT